MTTRLLTLIIKEFKAIWKDPRSRMIVTIMPIIQLIVFANAVTMEVKNIDMLVLDNSRSYYSRELISHFANSPWFNSVAVVDTPEQLKQSIDIQKASLALEIPPDFAVSIKNKTGASVQLITDGRQTNSASIIGSYATQIIQSYAKELSGSEPRLKIVTRNWFNVNLDYKYYSLVSLMAMLSMVIVLLLTSLSIAREKEVGTFDQLIVSPLSSTEILIGKAVPAQLLAWLLTMVMLAISVHFFDFPLVGSLAVFLAADFVALLALVGVGLFISSLCRTQQQAILGVFTFQMPAVLLSGFISPIDNMPVILQYLTYLNPLRFFLVIAKGVLLKNMDMYHVLINLTPLALIAVLKVNWNKIIKFRKLLLSHRNRALYSLPCNVTSTFIKKQALRFIRNRGLVFQPFSFISADFDQIVIRVTHIKALHFP